MEFKRLTTKDAKEFGFTVEEVDEVLTWYTENLPVAKTSGLLVFSATAFRSKYQRIRALAMQYGIAHPDDIPLELQDTFDSIWELGWPPTISHASLGCTLKQFYSVLCRDSVPLFTKIATLKVSPSVKDRLQAADMERYTTTMRLGAPPIFLLYWFVTIHSKVSRWEQWAGSFDAFAPSLRNAFYKGHVAGLLSLSYGSTQQALIFLAQIESVINE